MRKWLRSLLDWADKRWPERVVVTLESYLALNQSLERLNDTLKDFATHADLTSLHNRIEILEKTITNMANAIKEADFDKRIKTIEGEINKLNVHAGFSKLGDGAMKMFQR